MDSKQVVKGYTRRYVVALVLVAGLASGWLAISLYTIQLEDGAAARVNVSGRQRMLSQRIAFGFNQAAAVLESGETADLTLLRGAVALMRESHARLAVEGVDPELAGPLPPALEEIYYGSNDLHSRVTAYLDSASVGLDSLQGAEATVSPTLVAFLNAHAQGPLLAGLDSAVAAYEAQGVAGVERLARIEVLLWMSTLALVAILALRVFRPMGHELEDALETVRDREATVLRSQHLHQVGYMAAGIAHDLKNFTNVANGNLQLLEEELREAEMDTGPAEDAQSALLRIDLTARRLLAIARKESETPAVMELGPSIRQHRALLRQAASPSDFALSADPELHVVASPWELESALINLVSNASEAIGPRPDGLIRISFELEDPDTVLLAVDDNGPGVPPELVDRVFDPFVSGKERGEGTGLGLAQVRDFASDAGGDVRVTTSGLGGARFEIRLPRAHKETHTGSAGEASPVV